MRPRLPLVLAALALGFTACASDSDGDTSGGQEPVPATDTSPGADQAESGGSSDSDTPTLALTDTTPADATLVIDALATTTDRTIRRGGQSAIEQGQTFAVDSDSTLDAVSFFVVATDPVPAGQSVELTVYEIGDPDVMLPSGIVDVAGADSLVMSLPESIEPDVPVHLAFSIPSVQLTAGQYAVVLSFGDGSGPVEMFVQHPEGDEYADGVAISLEGEFWKPHTNGEDSAVTVTLDA